MTRAFTFLVAALGMSSCAAPQTAMLPEAPRPQSVDLQEERSVATMHFRPGLYSLDAADRTGWYYRAPEGVIEHSFGTFQKHEGGIFLARNGSQMRGYIVWAGGRTKIGDFSHAYHVFR